jgi:hypothetical protein
MGREVRMVPPDWQHPKDERGRYIPMFEQSHAEAVRQWEEEDLPKWREDKRLWDEEGKVNSAMDGIVPIEVVYASVMKEKPYRYPEGFVPTFDDWAGDEPRRPDPADYMPDWPDAERTHYMMYEDTSEGTPISPAFATPEELALWLADTGASSFAGRTATYEQWLRVAQGGWAPSAVIEDGVLRSGVEAVT